MIYALAVFSPGPRFPPNAALDEEHVTFITGLARDHAILLGGNFHRPLERFAFAYVLRCGSLEEATATVEREPYVREGTYVSEIVEWKLVGIDPDAIDKSLIVDW